MHSPAVGWVSKIGRASSSSRATATSTRRHASWQRQGANDQRHARECAGAASRPNGGEKVPTPRPEPTAPRSYHFPSFVRATLKNGMQLVVAPVPKLPLVSIAAVVDAGASSEREGEEGAAALTAQLLLEGAAGMDGAALTDRFERIGTSAE